MQKRKIISEVKNNVNRANKPEELTKTLLNDQSKEAVKRQSLKTNGSEDEKIERSELFFSPISYHLATLKQLGLTSNKITKNFWMNVVDIMCKEYSNELEPEELNRFSSFYGPKGKYGAKRARHFQKVLAKYFPHYEYPFFNLNFSDVFPLGEEDFLEKYFAAAGHSLKISEQIEKRKNPLAQSKVGNIHTFLLEYFPKRKETASSIILKAYKDESLTVLFSFYLTDVIKSKKLNITLNNLTKLSLHYHNFLNWKAHKYDNFLNQAELIDLVPQPFIPPLQISPELTTKLNKAIMIYDKEIKMLGLEI